MVRSLHLTAHSCEVCEGRVTRKGTHTSFVEHEVVVCKTCNPQVVSLVVIKGLSRREAVEQLKMKRREQNEVEI